MNISLSSGNYDIISNGQVFLFDKDDVFRMKMGDNENALYVELRFVQTDEKVIDVKRTIEGDTLILTCYNFDDEGTGLTSPYHIMSTGDKEVYLLFWSYLEGRTANVRVVSYTLFMSK